MVRDIVEPSPEGCFVAVSRNGWATGATESEALRNLHLAAGNQREIEVWESATLRRGAVWVDAEHCICWQGGEHAPPSIVAKIINGKRQDVAQAKPSTEETPPTPPPTGYVAKMIAKRRAKP